jgi:cytochrome c oxidase assembly protein subunit 11
MSIHTADSRKNYSLAVSLAAIVIGMVMLSFASVPLYRLFCQVTGFGGTTQLAAGGPVQAIERDVTVSFNTDTAQGLPWEFEQVSGDTTMKVGEKTLAFFEATNNSDQPIDGTSIYNVTPHKVGEYFVKMECFCFEKQTIQPGETVNFPVSFYIDPSISEDPTLDDVTHITLSYTFFPYKE